MKISSFFGKVGRIFTSPKLTADVKLGATVLSAFNPGLGSVVETIAGVVYAVESSVAAGTSGSDKKSVAKNLIDVAAPSILQSLSGVSGQAVNATKAAPTVEKLIDDCVALFNDLGVFTHATLPS